MRDWDRTIVARITPLGQGGIGVVRLSGPDAVSIASRFVRVEGGRDLDALAPRYLANASVDRDGAIWDRGLVVRFVAPRSFTGEDVVEIHLHGNPLIVDGVIELAVAAGARLAEAGEFTMRAVLNGKLDLIQAEAVGEAIEAESAEGVRIAQRQLGGELSRRLSSLRQRVVEALARLELELDFSEEGYSFLDDSELAGLIADLRAEVEALLRNFRNGAALRSGPRVLLLGRPNAGKSSFFNSVLGYSRSLVSSAAGTTRDYLEEKVVHRGTVLHLVDTAGLREASDDLEAEGVRRALALADEADVALYLVDASVASNGMTDTELDDLRSSNPDLPIEWVWTKSDLGVMNDARIACSTSDPASIERVLDLVVDRWSVRSEGGSALVSRRQALLLEELSRGVDGIQVIADRELLSADLRSLLEPLSALVGATTNEDVLDAVFSGFCIGK